MRRLLVILLAVAAIGLVGRDVVPCRALPVQPRCYVALYPGPAEDTLRIVEVPDERTYASSGEILLTTVAVDTELDPLEWLRTAVSSRVRQVPREVLYPPGAGEDDVRRQNVAQMDESQVLAAGAALRALGHTVDLDPKGAEVVEVDPEMPAGRTLTGGDVIVEVNGRPVTDAAAAADAIASFEAGTEVQLEILRDGERLEVPVTVAADPSDPGRVEIGAVLRDHIVLPVDVRIDAGQVGGPSAGLMFALAIVDVLGPDDLTGGRVIAGTGTIDLDGSIGAIGGIRQKVLGALEREDGRAASVFLVPAENLREARGAPVGEDILLVPVATLSDALDALRQLREGRQPQDAVALGGGR